MKKVLVIIFIFFGFYNTSFGGSYSPYCSDNKDREDCIEEKVNAEKLKKLTIEVEKNSLEDELKIVEEATSLWYEKYLEILNKQKEVYEIEIYLLELENCTYDLARVICSDSIRELKKFYSDLLIENSNEIEENQKELEVILEEDKKKLEEEKQEQARIEKEKQAIETSQEYLEKAGVKLRYEEYDRALSMYERSCQLVEGYECYYGVGISQYELAKEHYKRIDAYGYEARFQNAIESSITALEASLELSDDETNIDNIKALVLEIKGYPHKEKTEEKQEASNSKVEAILQRIEKKTQGYSDEKKQATYTALITQLEAYKNKVSDNELQSTLEELIEVLKGYTEEELASYDRTEDFYKTTLQEKTYSCEISATSDILSTIKNKDVSEDELIEQIDKSIFGETAQYSNGIYIWGNPNEGFVGYIDTDAKGNVASQRNLTGYGVYEAPIAELYNDHGVKTEILNNSHYTTSFGPEQHLQKLLQEFTEGNHIQLWGDICTTPEYDDGELALADITQEDVNNGKNAKNECWSYGQDRKRVWYYKEGEKLIKHQGLIGEHNFYLLGYEGDIDNPVNIIVWDTSTGKHTYPIKEWMRKWEEMDFRSIIIYSK